MHRFSSYRSLILLPFLVLCSVSASADSRSRTAIAQKTPAYLLELPDSIDEVLIADTGAATLYRFEIRGHSVLSVDQRYMSIGLNGAGKKRAWDRKTPLGVYFITEKLDTSGMNARYGSAAFPLDYPNAWDRRNDRTGYGIWLHGVDRKNPQRPAHDTDGCLALANPELMRLAGSITPLKTPIIVAREIAWAAPGELDALRSELRAVLDRWRTSLEQGDLQGYLDLYHDDFTHRGMDKAAWSSYRLRVFAARELSSLRLDDVMLLADPEERELYLSRFTQIAAGSAGEVTITKRLYWKRDDINRWRIVSEDAG